MVHATALTIVALLGVMLWASWRVTLAMLLIAPLIGVHRMGRSASAIAASTAASRKAWARMAQAAEQALPAQQDVKVYGAQAFEQARYPTLANRNLRLNLKVEATRASSSALVQMLARVRAGRDRLGRRRARRCTGA